MLLAWWSADANQYVLTEINGAWCFTLDETWAGINILQAHRSLKKIMHHLKKFKNIKIIQESVVQ